MHFNPNQSSIIVAGGAGRSIAVRGAIESRILAGFVGMLLLLFIASGYTYRTSAEFAQSAHWVAHNQQVRAELGQLEVAIFEAESAQRNYVLTGEVENREAYTRLAAEVDEHQQNLSRLVSDDPGQMQNVAALRPLIVQHMNTLAQQVFVFERQGASAAFAAMVRDDGISAMATIDSLVQRMDSVEKQLLSRREAEQARNREVALGALPVTLATATAMLVLLWRGIRREFAERDITERTQVEQELSCDVAQGCFTAKPVPGPDLPAWVKAWKAP